MSDNLLK